MCDRAREESLSIARQTARRGGGGAGGVDLL